MRQRFIRSAFLMPVMAVSAVGCASADLIGSFQHPVPSPAVAIQTAYEPSTTSVVFPTAVHRINLVEVTRREIPFQCGTLSAHDVIGEREPRVVATLTDYTAYYRPIDAAMGEPPFRTLYHFRLQ